MRRRIGLPPRILRGQQSGSLGATAIRSSIFECVNIVKRYKFDSYEEVFCMRNHARCHIFVGLRWWR